jgi:hypothetical protein
MTDLSTHESAIYDRQIRLWGSNAQLRIKQGHVLVVGVSSTTAEICKNTALAGANLIIVDDRPITPENVNFLISLEVDSSRWPSLTAGQATVEAARRLNAHPSILAISAEQIADNIQNVDAVVITSPLTEFSRVLSIAKSCRELKKCVFIVFDSAAASWAFSDMGQAHVVESHTAPLRRDERTGDRKSDQRTIEYQFASFDEFLSSGFEPNIGVSKPFFPLPEILFVRLYLEYVGKPREDAAPSPKRTRRSASPSRVTGSGSSSAFRAFVTDKLHSLANMEGRLGKTFKQLEVTLTNDIVSKYERLNEPSPPHFAAIHGALVSQEIVKFITKRDIPLVNQIVVNPRDCGCIVVRTPMGLGSRIIDSGNQDEDEVEVVTGIEGLD